MGVGGAEIQNDIAEYSLHVFQQIGVISANIDKAAVKPKNNEYRGAVIVGTPKKETLAAAGIDIRREGRLYDKVAVPF